MDLTPYLDSLRQDLSASAAPGGPDVLRAAELLGGSLDASARLTLMQVLADAAAEITARLETATIEVRLRGREADLVVTELGTADQEPPVVAPVPETGDVSRVTLRLPEPLKDLVEHAASSEGISVNAWLVRAVAIAVQPGGPGQRGGQGHWGSQGRPNPPGTARTSGKRLTGFAQA